MSTLETSPHSSPQTAPETIDPYDDPVAFLADCGIDAELVHVISLLPEAA
jgi:hypothetical protein